MAVGQVETGELPEGSAPRQMRVRKRVLADLLGGRWRRVAGLAVASTLSGVAEAGILAIVAEVAADLAGGDRGATTALGPLSAHLSIPALLWIGAVLALVRLVLQVPMALLPARIASDTQANLRRRLFDAFTRASWEVQSTDREGYLQELMSTQVFLAGTGAIWAASAVTYALTFAVLLASALVLSAAAAGAVLIVSLALFAALRPLSRAAGRAARGLAEAQVDHAQGLGEATRLAEETHVFGVEASQRQHIGLLIDQARAFFFRAQLFVRLVPNIYQSFVYLLIVGGLALVYHFVSGGVASLGAVVLLLVRAGTYGNQLQNAYQQVRQAVPFLEHLQTAEARYRESIVPAGRRPLSAVRTLAFVDVSFDYGAERPALSGVSFEVHAGETIGIVGPSGAGKSTLAQLILQLRSPQSGRYLVNGSAAHEYQPSDWHGLVAYIPQTPNLIHASVSANIRFLRDLSDADVERAARLAGIHDDIMSWSDSYETIVGPRADAVSGGQSQRICLARALAGRPQILLLDEPTSALDPTSERLIQQSLNALSGTMTLLVIAHRMTTLDICDRVMVILDGRLDAFGSADSIRDGNAYYRSAELLSDAARP
ncbi:MAG TPA: ABC transporter ATP-binding protein [Solirubrobacteraceae bacterium]|jgi:ABC-type multidrug transport system fused ATPase/permease subunit